MRQKRVIASTHQPNPFPEHGPKGEKEERIFANWLLGEIEDEIDESIAFVKEQLLTAGLKDKQASVVLNKMIEGALYPWMRKAVWSNFVDDELCYYYQPNEAVQDFLEAKFGIEQERTPPITFCLRPGARPLTEIFKEAMNGKEE